MVAILAIISVILLTGRGSFLIAGFNTASKENKQKYNTKRLCRVWGSGTSLISVISGIATFYRFEMPANISWIIPWGLFGILAIEVVLANTICWKKPDDKGV
jgi:hypothetical protein